MRVRMSLCLSYSVIILSEYSSGQNGDNLSQALENRIQNQSQVLVLKVQPWTDSFSSTWELVRHANSQALSPD